MIDEWIPDLFHPMMRDLYLALLGRREPTRQEKGALIAVAEDMIIAYHAGKTEITLPSATAAANVCLIIDRAICIDRQGTLARIDAWLDEFGAIDA